MVITSTSNEKVKDLKKLKQKKYRESTGTFVVENFKIIIDALADGYDCQEVFVTESFIEKNKEEWDKFSNQSKVEINFINDKVNKAISNLSTPAGIFAVYKKQEGNETEKQGAVIYLNGINDPGNLGTILRSALAFNLTEVVVDEKCADIYNYKTVSAAKDAIFKLNIQTDYNQQWLKKYEGKIFITSLDDDAKSLDEISAEKEYCLVLGSESHGVDEIIEDLATNKVKIEMGDQIESLNVASAAAIIFNAVYKKLKNVK